MKNLIQIISFVSIIFVNIAIAAETEVVATIDGKAITNIDVFKERSKSIIGTYCDHGCMQSVLERIITPLLFEQYAERNNLQATEQQGTDNLKKTNALARLAIEHFDANFLVVTEQDIQEFLDYHKKRGTKPSKVGTTEWIGYRLITLQKDGEANLNELKTIKQRINNGEKFENVVHDYNNQDGFRAPSYPHGMTIRDVNNESISKQGVDALTPWSKLKGKAVIVNWAGGKYYEVWVIDDYVSETRTTFENALKIENMRQEAIKQVISHKFSKVKLKLLEKLRNENIKYVDISSKRYQKLADGYESWWIEAHKDEPDFQQRLDNMRNSKKEYMERQKNN